MAANTNGALVGPLVGDLRRVSHKAWLASAASSLRLAAPIALFAYALSALKLRAFSPDTFFCLDIGRFIAAHWVPHSNEFTAVAAGKPWIDPQWLTHLSMFESWRFAGYPGIVLMAAAGCAAASVALVHLLRGAGLSRARAVLFATLGTVMMAPAITARAQVFALPIFVVTLGLLLKAMRQRRASPIVLTLPMLVLWANVHGSVMLGALLVAACAVVLSWWLLRDGRIGEAIVAALSAAAACATPLAIPYSPNETISYYRSLVSDPVLTRFVAEWRAPTLGISWGGIFFFVPLAAALLVVGFALSRRYKPPLALLISAAISAVVASRAVRFSPWFDVIAVVLIGDVLQQNARALVEPGPRLRTAIAAVALSLAVLATAVIATTRASSFETQVGNYPVGAAGTYLSSRPQARVLADELTANFLLWKFPRLNGRIAYDVRFEQYSTNEQLGYFDWVSGSTARWMDAATGYQVLVGADLHPGLVRRLRELHGWRILVDGRGGIAVVRGA